jgi:hypothetical protein
MTGGVVRFATDRQVAKNECSYLKPVRRDDGAGIG